MYGTAQSEDRFTPEEWSLLKRHGGRCGLAFGVVYVVVLVSITVLLAPTFPTSSGSRWQLLGGTLLVASPICWLAGWLLSLLLPHALRAKSWGRPGDGWVRWLIQALFMLGAFLLAIGQPVWVGLVVFGVAILVMHTWGRKQHARLMQRQPESGEPKASTPR